MSYQNINAKEVETLLNQPGAIALDLRDYQSYETGHLLGAEHADAWCMSKLLKKRGENPLVLVYCYRGNMSRDYAQLVSRLGFDKVYHLVGGYNSWIQFACD